MKKKTTKKTTKRVATRKVVRRSSPARSSVHGPMHDCPECMARYGGMWGKDRNMILLLAAGTIILAVVGMWMAGWL